MASWSTKRKFIYSSSFILVFILLIALPLFYLLYKPPTCIDNKQNGNETGIDCGGSCIRLCQNSFISPRISWGNAKFEKISDGLYNVASYIINSNINGAANNVPYKIDLYDSKGQLIVEKQGSIDLYAHRNSLAFESAISTGKRIPAKATFEFINGPIWFKSHDALDGLIIADKRYTEDENSSSLEIELKNKSLKDYNNLSVAVVLYDIDSNVIGFSKTIVDNIQARGESEFASFTWPIGRNNKVVSIEVLPTMASIEDR